MIAHAHGEHHLTPDSAARRLTLHAAELAVSPELLARLAETNSQLLLLEPEELRARVALLSSALGLQSPRDLLDLACKHPTLVTRFARESGDFFFR